MPRPALRSTSLRKIKRVLPGGATTIHYVRGKTAKPKCARCKKVLSGTARGTSSQVKKLAKSKKTPSRAYGGNLCPSCAREALKETKLR
jgi:large subunit ribosomal protein L34e